MYDLFFEWSNYSLYMAIRLIYCHIYMRLCYMHYHEK